NQLIEQVINEGPPMHFGQRLLLVRHDGAQARPQPAGENHRLCTGPVAQRLPTDSVARHSRKLRQTKLTSSRVRSGNVGRLMPRAPKRSATGNFPSSAAY